MPMLGIVGLLVLLLAGTGASLRWLVATDAGAAWLMQRLPVAQIKGFKGTLAGPSWHVDALRIEWDQGRQWLLIEGLTTQGVQWQWRPHAQAWVGLSLKTLQARKITVQTGAPGPRPIKLPGELVPPVQLTVAAFQVDELVVDGREPQRALIGTGLSLDPRAGAVHRVEKFSLQSHGLAVAGAAEMGNAQPYKLAAQVSLQPVLAPDAPAWAAVLKASGTLAEVEIEGSLRGRPQGKQAAPSVDLRLGLHPLQHWVLAHLSAQTEALDLAALSPKAPSTRLSGQATLKGGVDGTPLVAEIKLDNTTPGRWNERRLPLRKLALVLRGRLAQPEQLDITRFEVALADATRSAGRWSGSAVWAAHTLTLDTRLDNVTPQRLDGRAAAMTLSGPVALTLRGLPSPDFRSPGTAPSPGMSWKLDLQGQLDAKPQTVRLALEGSADDQRLDIKQAHAQSGSASAHFSASLARAGRGEWLLDSTGKVLNFDPLPWWPGDAGTAWRRGPHKLSGDWRFDLRLPGEAENLPPLTLAQRLVGNGTLKVQDSVLAGVPLSADITLAYTPSAASAPAALRAELQLGGNQLRIDGGGNPAGSGAGDRWRVDLSAQALSGLAPLTQLSPALAEWVPRKGSITALLTADGRWPAMRTEGSARVSQLEIGPLALARGSAAWRMATQGEQPLALQLDLAGLVYGKQRADHLRADLRGTLAEHHIDISGAMPVKPPALAEQMLGIQAQSGTRAQMQAQGQWLPNAAGGGRWKAHIERLVLGSWDGSAGTAPPASGWAESRDLRAELEFGPGAKLLALQAAPGRVRLADTAALRWDEVRMDLRGEQVQLQLHADIEPFALAPLLARAQPDRGWQGDLRLAARVDIRAAEKMDLDLVVERQGGDLHMVAGGSTQLLGLTELRLAISAHEGVWNFSPVFRGRSLGDISGQVRVQSTAERRWPQPQAPISGQVQARAADIGIWSGWVPPGWRLAGSLQTTAVLSGSFGEPLVNGELTGSGLAVRNLLQGVNISDGQVAIKLEGDTAKIERFTLKGGEGSASITGSAVLVGKPQARLQLRAERLRVLARVDRQLIVSGNAELLMDPERVQLDGKFNVDEAFYDAARSDAPSLDDDVTVRRAGDAADQPADPGAPKAKRGFVMGVEINLGDKVRISGRGLDTGLRGQVRLSTPGGRLAVNGTIAAASGTYAAYGQKLEIERGIVAFSGVANNPRLDVLALRPNIDTRVGVAITGNLLTPRIRLFSEPEMSDSDKLSWLVLGRASDGLGRNDTAMLQRAALALLAGEGEAPTDALMKSLGIDEVSLRQSDGEVRETVISIGKQLSRRWYLGYERGVNATTGTWQLIYRIAQRFTLRLQSGLESALDLIWTFRTQETPADAGMRKSTVIPP